MFEENPIQSVGLTHKLVDMNNREGYAGSRNAKIVKSPHNTSIMHGITKNDQYLVRMHQANMVWRWGLKVLMLSPLRIYLIGIVQFLLDGILTQGLI